MAGNDVRVNDAGPKETSYSEPFGWWGFQWAQPEPRSLVWLIEHGALDVPVAAFLSLAIEARSSIIVAAEPHEAGKTTLLTALLDFLPDGVQPVYLRGWYERFHFLDTIPPESAYVLCNEISAHLPTYLWGRGVRRMFEAVMAGYPLATTMHAAEAADAFDQLAAYPLNVPVEHLSTIDLVVIIGVGYINNRLQRRISRIERVRAGALGPHIEVLASRQPLRGEIEYQVGRLIGALARLHGCSDSEAATAFARRTRQLEAWRAAGLGTAPSLRDAVLAARRGEALHAPDPADSRQNS